MLSKLVKRLICCNYLFLLTFGGIQTAPTTSVSGLPEKRYHDLEGNTKGMLLYDGRTVAEIFFDRRDPRTLKHCHLYDLDDPRKTDLLKERHANEIVQNTDFRTMLDLIIKCRELEEVASDDSPLPSNMTESTWSLLDGIVPGTKWCGLGDIAENYNDLGSRSDVDVCCRAHDHCPIRLKAFRTGFGLINLSIYTKSHCACDEDFLHCLKQTNSRVADLIGNLYFNVLKVQCIKEEHPLKCVTAARVVPSPPSYLQALVRAAIHPIRNAMMTHPADLPRFVLLKDLLSETRYRLSKSIFRIPLRFTLSFDSRNSVTVEDQAICHRWELDRSTTRMKIITPLLVY